MGVSCMRHASGHNYRNSSFIVDVAMGQITRSTECISNFDMTLMVLIFQLGDQVSHRSCRCCSTCLECQN